MAPKTDHAAKVKELKDLIETTNTNIKLLENRITANHEELVARVCIVETQAKEALDLAKKNEIIINGYLQKQQETNDNLKSDLSKRVTTQVKEALREKCPYSELFWSAFSGIRIEYGEILRISPYSVPMREKADQNNSEYGHFLRSEIFTLVKLRLNYDVYSWNMKT